MYYKGLTWRFKLLLMSSCLVIGPLVLFSFYKEKGHLPNSIIAGVIIASLLGCLLLVLGERSWRKYYRSKQTGPDSSDEQ
jgi:hypothetical protein